MLLIFFRLDAALIRPGRVDVKEFIGYATDYQLKLMYKRFYPEPELSVSSNLPDLFASEIKKLNKPVSMAEVQGLFMCYKNDPKGIIENVDKIGTL